MVFFKGSEVERIEDIAIEDEFFGIQLVEELANEFSLADTAT